MYNCFLMSVLDYASVVYGTMLNSEKEYDLEMLHATALKIIYGQKNSYDQLIERSGLERLSDRHERLIDRFIIKARDNPRFMNDWFPKRHESQHDIRNEKKYAEFFARTTRLYKSPIYHYRRRMNFLVNVGK